MNQLSRNKQIINLHVFCFHRVSHFFQNRHLLKEMQSIKKLNITYFHLSKEAFSMQLCSRMRYDISWMIRNFPFHWCLVSKSQKTQLQYDGLSVLTKLIQIKAAIAVTRNVRGLPPAQDFKKHGAFVDLFDFLQHCFGFQVSPSS